MAAVTDNLKAPFPAFGGKSRVAHIVWPRLSPAHSPARNYCEPFCFSAAMLLLRPDEPKIETINDLNAYVCLAPNTRVLRADLTWGMVGDVAIGDKLLGFDEQNGPARHGLRAPTRYRRWQVATVTNVRRVVKPCYRLKFDDGTEAIASEDHQWLIGPKRSGGRGGRGWRWGATKGLVCNRSTQRSWVLKLAPVVDREESHDAGWLGGILDGEGCMSGEKNAGIVIAQNPGGVLERAVRLLNERGFDVRREDRGNIKAHVNGGQYEVLRLLMLARPGRLIGDFLGSLNDRSIYGREHNAVGLIEKEFVGDREVVAVETDTHTFVAEGLASHNCNFWRAIQADPEAVAAHADWPVNEVDLHARHRWLVQSEDAHDALARVRELPEYFDAKIAGWWCWGACMWIGSGWCEERGVGWAQPSGADTTLTGVHRAPTEQIPDLHSRGSNGGVHGVADFEAKRPQLCNGNTQHGQGVHKRPRLATFGTATQNGQGGLGVHADPELAGQRGVLSQQIPELAGPAAPNPRQPALGQAGWGVNALGDANRPQLADAYSRGRGIHGNDQLTDCDRRRLWLVDWFARLSDRLRPVRVCCGHWMRVCDSESTLTRLGTTAVFLDPPYRKRLADGTANRAGHIYANDKIQDVEALCDEVQAWSLKWGDNPEMRIAVCGLEGEYPGLDAAGWEKVAWKSQGGYGNRNKDNENAARERIWFSPHCVKEGEWLSRGYPGQKSLFGESP